MGITKAVLTVKNLKDAKKQLKGEFLVDSGAFYTVLPKRWVEKLGVKPSFEQEFSLADGSRVKRKIGHAMIEFEGRETPSPVVLGEIKDAALMGVLTLESLGLVLNPFDRTLRPAHLML